MDFILLEILTFHLYNVLTKNALSSDKDKMTLVNISVDIGHIAVIYKFHAQ